MIKSFSELLDQVKSEKPRKIAVAMAEDKDVIKAVEKARSLGLTKPLLTGNPDKISLVLKELNIDKNNYEIESAADEHQSVSLAVENLTVEKNQILNNTNYIYKLLKELYIT